jgi:hypothetical protein
MSYIPICLLCKKKKKKPTNKPVGIWVYNLAWLPGEEAQARRQSVKGGHGAHPYLPTTGVGFPYRATLLRTTLLRIMQMLGCP